MMPIRVLIADDEAVVRDSLRLLIEHEPGMVVVAEAADGVGAVERAAVSHPDVVLMDVQMPIMTGLEATRQLCREAAGPRVIVLTTFDLDEYAFEALQVGASGFLLKNSPPSDVLRAVRVASEGDALLAPELTRRLIDRFVRPGTARVADPRIEKLTERERETLTLIGRGLSNAEIAAKLFVTQTTARTYVSRILSKLGARDRAQLVVLAYETRLISA